ncbi:MAG: DUF952 domain-containing protein [Myxococcota bacterium]|nr:DUF952 domain-containing protein [Myxococcota bacterium]
MRTAHADRHRREREAMLSEATESAQRHDPFVYRIVVPEDWRNAKKTGHIPAVEVDRIDGYFHLSPHDQILVTARMYFSPEQTPAVIEFEADALGPTLMWEPVPQRGGRQFPHLYAEVLPLSAATALIELIALSDGGYQFGSRTALSPATVHADETPSK